MCELLEQQMAAYVPSEGYTKQTPRIKAPTGVKVQSLVGLTELQLEELTRKTLQRQDRDNGKPKRPLSAYMCYVQVHGAAARAKLQSTSFADLGKQLGVAWHRLTEHERAVSRKMPYATMSILSVYPMAYERCKLTCAS